jgi:drug/metabolite transporter (DMT)-like permease
MSQRLSDLPSIPVVCASLLLVAIGYLPFAAFHPPTDVAANGWWSIAVLGLVCTALAFVLFFALITAIGPARAVVITYVNPAVAVLLGVLLLNEDFTLGMAVGFPLILVGSVLAARRRTAPAVPAVPEAVICETIDETRVQSMRTGPDAVSKTAATTPVPPSAESSHSTSIPSSG